MTQKNSLYALCRNGLLACALLAFSLLVVSACGSEDTGQKRTCQFDLDCALGTVCGFDNSCVTAPCDFCTDGQICFITPENPEGSCSAPQCTITDDCDEGTCVGGVCKSGPSGCTNSSQCTAPNQICGLAGTCVDKPAGCTDSTQCENEGEICTDGKCAVPPCTASSCENGQTCNTSSGKCETPPSCDTIVCDAKERCIIGSGQCVHDCISDSSLCQGVEVCNQISGACEANPCPGSDPSSCAGATPHFSTQFCSCVACAENNHCTGGKVCNNNGQCVPGECQNPCDPNVPNACNGTTPYCLSGCCSECVGAADCPVNQLCLDGFCGNPPDCSIDPTVCPAGYTCQGGQCQAPQTGQSCDPQNPTSCPQGTFCTASGQCEAAGGDFGCGFCNEDCTCPGALSCDGFLCSGCQLFGGQATACPSGQICGDLLGLPVCLPFRF
ncbi:MAG: hypothetical protein H0U74_12275 [Bradymonadaceae bacterium]|nr:hypothetical protein [Lujinxingiaceae bacterium]